MVAHINTDVAILNRTLVYTSERIVFIIHSKNNVLSLMPMSPVLKEVSKLHWCSLPWQVPQWHRWCAVKAKVIITQNSWLARVYVLHGLTNRIHGVIVCTHEYRCCYTELNTRVQLLSNLLDNVAAFWTFLKVTACTSEAWYTSRKMYWLYKDSPETSHKTNQECARATSEAWFTQEKHDKHKETGIVQKPVTKLTRNVSEPSCCIHFGGGLNDLWCFLIGTRLRRCGICGLGAGLKTCDSQSISEWYSSPDD